MGEGRCVEKREERGVISLWGRGQVAEVGNRVEDATQMGGWGDGKWVGGRESGRFEWAFGWVEILT